MMEGKTEESKLLTFPEGMAENQHDLRMKVTGKEFKALLPEEIEKAIRVIDRIEDSRRQHDLRMKFMEKKSLSLPDEIAAVLIEAMLIDRIEDSQRQHDLRMKLMKKEFIALLPNEIAKVTIEAMKKVEHRRMERDMRIRMEHRTSKVFPPARLGSLEQREHREWQKHWEWCIRRSSNLLNQPVHTEEFKELVVLSMGKKLIIKILQFGADIAKTIKSMEEMLKECKSLINQLLKSGDNIEEATVGIGVNLLAEFRLLTVDINLFLLKLEVINITGEKLEEIKHFNSGDDYIAEKIYRMVKKYKDFTPLFSHIIKFLESRADIVEETFQAVIELSKSGAHIAEAKKRTGKKIKDFVARFSNVTEKMWEKLTEFISPLLDDIKLLSNMIDKPREDEERHLIAMPIMEEESKAVVMGVEEESHDLERGPEEESYNLESGSSKVVTIPTGIEEESHGLEGGYSLESGSSKVVTIPIGMEEEWLGLEGGYSLESGSSKVVTIPMGMEEEWHGLEGGYSLESGSSKVVTIPMGIEEESHGLEGGLSIEEKESHSLESGSPKVVPIKMGMEEESHELEEISYDVESEPSTFPMQEQNSGRWEIQRSIVLGGLIESITSLVILTSAANANISDGNIITFTLANLITGLFIVRHNVSGVEKRRLKNRCSNGAGLEGSSYIEVLRENLYYFLHLIIAFLSFLFSGLVAPLVYAFSFHESRNKNLKIIAAAAASLSCTAVLAIQKAHIQNPKKWLAYFKTACIYVSIGFGAFGLSYLAGYIFGQLIDKLSWVH